MIWSKTDAGRLEIQTRALVKERALRNLLLLIDGVRTQESLLAGLAGISAADFEGLRELGLIVPLPASGGSRGSAAASARAAAPAASASNGPSAAAAPRAPLDYSQFTAALTQMISKELGLRGFVLTLAVEKASTIEELRAVAQRTLTQIGERKGDAAAAAARRALYGD